MIYPRFFAQLLAWLGGYFWLPCPVCKEPFAGFEVGAGCVVVKESDGDHMYCVCPRPSCQAEGERNYRSYMQRLAIALSEAGSAERDQTKAEDK